MSVLTLIVMIFCAVFTLLLLIGAFGGRGRVDVGALCFGLAFACWALAVASTGFDGESRGLHSISVYAAGIVGAALFVVGFLVKLFPGGKFDPEWFSSTVGWIVNLSLWNSWWGGWRD